LKQFKCLGFRKGTSRTAACLAAISLAFSVQSSGNGEWEAVTNDADIRALFSGTTMHATLKDGVDAVATYNSGGTGSLKAWGGIFQRQWKVKNGGACLLIDSQWRCFDIERNFYESGNYRATMRDTQETLLFSVEGSNMVATSPIENSEGGAAAPSADEVAKKLANPNTPLATITLRTQVRGFKGDLPDAGDQNSTTVLLQPSFPFPVSDNAIVYFRPGIPLLIDQPIFEGPQSGFGEESGLGDIGFDLGYGVTNKDTGVILAGGIISTLPTATKDELGADRYSLGPELLVGLLRENYVLGAFPNHQWNVTGSGDKDFSTTSVQLFGIGLPGGGWNIGTKPIINYDWKGDEWTIPVQIDIGKTVIWSGRPWKLGVELNYYVEQADAFGPEWMIGINIGPVVENVMAGWFK